ncbi:MAG: hypothetical protein ACWA5T_10965 [Parvularcula sp.]
MLKLTRHLLLIAVAFLAARPAMACCLAGHDAADPSVSESGSPPCHESKGHAADETIHQDGQAPMPTDCPGCPDCQSVVMAAHSVTYGAVLTGASNDLPLATIANRFAGFEFKPTVLTTGPPDYRPPPAQTPIALQQRLLI